MKNTLTQEQKDFNFLPRDVIESRWNRKEFKIEGYSPEVSFYGEHYIVGSVQDTREKAEKIAKDKAAEVKEAMLKVGKSILSMYPTAKE